MTNTLRLSGKYQPTIQQRGIITQLTNDTLSEVSYIVKLAFLVSPAIDPRRLERAFAKLAARHEAIRQSFEQQGNEWFVNVWNRHQTGLVVEDHGDIGDTEFDSLLQHHASVRIELLDDVLFQIVVLKCGRRGDVIFFRCHHAVVDGHSIVIVMEDWLNFLIGIPSPGRGVTHEEYLSEYSSLPPRQKKDNHDYWTQLLFPALPNPGLGKFGKSGERPRIVYRSDTIRSIKCSLNSDEFDKIPITTNARSQTSNAMILAAYADTIIELSGLPGIYVSSAVDRTSTKLRNYVGCASVWPPLRCDAANGMPLAEYASALASQLKQSLMHLPDEAQAYESEFDLAVNKSGGVIRHFNCSVPFIGARMKRSPFSPGLMAPQGTPIKIGPISMFTITRLAISVRNYNYNGLRLHILPDGNQTNLVFTYHDHFYSEKDLESLLSGMQEKLRIRLL